MLPSRMGDLPKSDSQKKLQRGRPLKCKIFDQVHHSYHWRFRVPLGCSHVKLVLSMQWLRGTQPLRQHMVHSCLTCSPSHTRLKKTVQIFLANGETNRRVFVGNTHFPTYNQLFFWLRFFCWITNTRTFSLSITEWVTVPAPQSFADYNQILRH